MVLIICTKNESNLNNRDWDMVPDGRTEWTDGRTTPKLYPSDFVGDKKVEVKKIKCETLLSIFFLFCNKFDEFHFHWTQK